MQKTQLRASPLQSVYAYLHGELTATLAKWRELGSNELPTFNALLHAHGVATIGEF